MAAHHELLQDTLSQDRDVMRAISARSPYVFRGKQNFRSRVLHDVIADHRGETVEVADLAKVDLLYFTHALRKRGLFENVEVKMKESEIKRAKIGDRVKFIPLEHDAGEPCGGQITHKLGKRVEITWDDGETCTMVPHDYTRVFLA